MVNTRARRYGEARTKPKAGAAMDEESTASFYDHVETLLRAGSAEALPQLQQVTDRIFEGDTGPLRRFLEVCAPLLPATGNHKAWDDWLAGLLDRDDVPPEIAGLLLTARILVLGFHDGQVSAARLALDPRLEAAPPDDPGMLAALTAVLAKLCVRFSTVAFLWAVPSDEFLPTTGERLAAQQLFMTYGIGLDLLDAARDDADPGPQPPPIVGIGVTGPVPPPWLGIADGIVRERYARFRDRWPSEPELRAIVSGGGDPRDRIAAADLLGDPEQRTVTRLDLAAEIAEQAEVSSGDRLAGITAVLDEVRGFGRRFPELITHIDAALDGYRERFTERVAELTLTLAAPVDPLEAVETRIIQAQEPDALDLVLDPSALDEAEALAAVDSGPDAGLALGWLFWLRSLALPESDQGESREVALDHLLPAVLAGVEPEFVPAPLLGEVSERAFAAAVQAQERLTQEFDEGLAAAAVQLWEHLARSDQAAIRSDAFSHLTATLLLRAERTGDPADLPAARAASLGAAESRPDDPMLWQNYLFTVHHSYLATGDEALLEAGLTAVAEAIEQVDRESAAFASLLANVSVVARSGDPGSSADRSADRISDDLPERSSGAVFDRISAAISLIEENYPLDEADHAAFAVDPAAEAVRVIDLAGRPGDIHLRGELGQLWLLHSMQLGESEGLAAFERAAALFRTCLLTGGCPVPPAGAEGAALVARPVADEIDRRAVEDRSPEPIVALPAMWLRLLEALPDDNEHRPAVLASLAAARLSQFQIVGGEPALLDEALADLGEAAGTTPSPERGPVLRTLGDRYRMSYEQTGRTAHLTTGMAAAQEAFALAGTDDERAACLDGIRRLLLARHYATGSGTDLDEARRAAEEALRLTPVEDYYYETRLVGIAETLRALASAIGDAGPLDEAVGLAVRAANAYEDGPQRAVEVLELTLLLIARHEAGGPASDLDAAVANTRHVLAFPGSDPEDAVRLRSALGVLLRHRHAAAPTEPNSDLDEALDLAREVLAATRPDHHARGPRLSDLAEALLLRFARDGEQADLDEAVDAARAAASLPSGVAHPVLLSRWAAGSLIRFDTLGDPGDLDAAITAYRVAVETTVSEHPARVERVTALAQALRRRGEQFQSSLDLAEATTLLSSVTPVPAPASGIPAPGPADVAPTSALPAPVDVAPTSAAPSSAFPGPVDDVSSLPVRGSVFPGLADAGPTADAPSSAFPGAATAPTSAFPNLAGAVPGFADSAPTSGFSGFGGPAAGSAGTGLAGSGSSLGDPGSGGPADSGGAGSGGFGAFASGGSGAELDEDPAGSAEAVLAGAAPGDPEAAWRALELLEAGRVGRYDHVLGRPSSRVVLADLVGEAGGGAVVTFTVGRSRSHALLLTPSGVAAVELPGLSRDILAMRSTAFRTALRIAAAAASRADAQQAINGTLAWLWQTATRPVLDALGHLSRPGADPDTLPRVWWAPGGLLGSLPLHAAGVAADAVPDRVVSSYTPTITALRYARRPLAATPGHRPLAVAMPARLAPPPVLADAVWSPTLLDRLPGHPIIHFGCQGWTDPDDPSRSGLHLPDGPLTVAEIMPSGLESVDLAYVGAAQTAVTRSDDAVHLASAFQIAGCRHVVSTHWAVDDTTVPDDFYRGLDRDPSPPAVALHRAIRRARDQSPDLPWLWAAHLHSGA